MSHGKSHHHHGDGGSHSHSSHHSGAERSESHTHHHSSTFHALHHEAAASLSSKPGAAHHDSSVNIDSSLAKPAAAKAAETVHITTAKVEKSASSTKADSAHTSSFKPTENHILDLHAIPKISLVNEAKPKQEHDLSSFVPAHLSENKANAQRVSGQAEAKNDLFAKAISDIRPQIVTPLSDMKPNVQRTAGQAEGQSDMFKQTVADAKPQTIIPGSDKQASAANGFDKSKSISDLTYAGAIVDRTAMVTDQQEKAKLNPGEVPQLKVSFTSPDQQTKPDFLIKQDGTIEMYNNPQTTGQKDIVVQFERNGDQFALTDAQKAAGGDFYSYLQNQLKSQYPQLASEAFKVDDSQGLLRDSKLPPEVKQNLEKQQAKPEVAPQSGLPEKSGPTMQDTRRINEGGRSSAVPRSDIDNMTPPAQRIPNEADRMAAMKDTVASYVTRGDKHPYDYVSKRGDRGWGIGRYGMTYGQMSNWLEGLTDEQIAELIKQGKLNPNQAANLKKMRDSVKHAKETGNEGDLHPFLKAMKNGEGTAEDMRKGVAEFMPDKVQELAASDQISKIAGELSKGAMQNGKEGSVDPGQVALSFVLGRTVDKQEFESNPQYKQFVDSARQAYRMQEQARMQGGDIINVENMAQVGDALNKMVGMQFWREAAGATEYGNKGCAIAVTRALQRMGVQIGTHLDVTGTAQEMRQRGWQEVSLAQAMRSGQLFVPVNKETGSHIGIGIGNQVWENSSGQRQFVTRNMNASTLRNSGRAFIVPIQAKDATKA